LRKIRVMLTSPRQKRTHVQGQKCARKRCWSCQRSRYCNQSQRSKRWTPWINWSDFDFDLITNTRKERVSKVPPPQSVLASDMSLRVVQPVEG